MERRRRLTTRAEQEKETKKIEEEEKENEKWVQGIWIKTANEGWEEGEGPIPMYERKDFQPRGSMPYFLHDVFPGWTPRFIDLKTFEPLAYRGRRQDILLGPGGAKMGYLSMLDKIMPTISVYFTTGITKKPFGDTFVSGQSFNMDAKVLARAIAMNAEDPHGIATRMLKDITDTNDIPVNYSTFREIWFQIRHRSNLLGRLVLDMTNAGITIKRSNASKYFYYFLGGSAANGILKPGEFLIRAVNRPGFDISLSYCYIDDNGVEQCEHPRIRKGEGNPYNVTGLYAQSDWVNTILMRAIKKYRLKHFVLSDGTRISMHAEPAARLKQRGRPIYTGVGKKEDKESHFPSSGVIASDACKGL